MKLIEKIEQALKYTVTDDDGNLFLFETAFNAEFETDEEVNIILEKVNKVIDFYNNSENKEIALEMEIEDILKCV